MQPVSVVAFFCEDIREEKSGQDIIIGVFPDNLNLTPSGPSEGAGTTVITKLGLYVRLHFDVNDTPPRQISARLVNADGTDIQLPGWTPEIIKKAFSDA